MTVVHELGTSGLQGLFNLFASHHESSNNFLHVFTCFGGSVTASLHRYDSKMIFFVDPDKKVGVIVVENTSTVGPVSSHAGGEEESGVG